MRPLGTCPAAAGPGLWPPCLEPGPGAQTGEGGFLPSPPAFPRKQARGSGQPDGRRVSCPVDAVGAHESETPAGRGLSGGHGPGDREARVRRPSGLRLGLRAPSLPPGACRRQPTLTLCSLRFLPPPSRLPESTGKAGCGCSPARPGSSGAEVAARRACRAGGPPSSRRPVPLSLTRPLAGGRAGSGPLIAVGNAGLSSITLRQKQTVGVWSLHYLIRVSDGPAEGRLN